MPWKKQIPPCGPKYSDTINSQEKENITLNFSFMQLQWSKKDNHIHAGQNDQSLQETKFKQINQNLHNIKWMLNVPKVSVIILIISSTSILFLKLLVVLKKRKSFYYVLLTDCRCYVFLPTPLWGGDAPHGEWGEEELPDTAPCSTQQLTWTCPAQCNLQPHATTNPSKQLAWSPVCILCVSCA